MSRLIVKYNNDLNTIPFRKFSKYELDLFFCICSMMKEQGLDTVCLSFKELARLINYPIKNIYKFDKELEKMYDKLIDLKFGWEDESHKIRFVLFTHYDIDKDNETIEISLNKKFTYLLNELTTNFTRFELKEFVKLKSTYSKSMFKLLKQFRQTGYYKVSVDELRVILSIPTTYNISDITKVVINPIEKELVKFFKNLKINKLSGKRGKRIEYLEFKFTKEDIKKEVKSNKTIIGSTEDWYKVDKDIDEKVSDEELEKIQSLFKE